ncbi:unnamed protein product [Rhizophagus irregularis]|uniref:Uncharacterized protein n=1 Tax=Rhizophagus irregularis TaxID=588596 RepID=A0A2I1GZZ8_9GLOM|nr:hypothetical protein RhiirA4_469686 [Rhizophagus irregularis]CAB4414353.1 unnamed protein product [Rhizophagus irregularis]
MSKLCKNLNVLIIHDYSQEKISGLISLIDAQRKLKSVSFEFHIKKGPTCKELSEALERKGNTINKLNLRSNFKFFVLIDYHVLKESATLVEKTKGNISQVIYTFDNVAENTGMLIKTISNNNCPNIEQLSTYLVPEDFDYVKSLLLNCKNLIYLGLNSLDYFTDMNDENDII